MNGNAVVHLASEKPTLHHGPIYSWQDVCRFNIWSTGPDLNFDRIAHLAKLVFNTKGVYISLVDGDGQCVMSIHYRTVYALMDSTGIFSNRNVYSH